MIATNRISSRINGRQHPGIPRIMLPLPDFKLSQRDCIITENWCICMFGNVTLPYDFVLLTRVSTRDIMLRSIHSFLSVKFCCLEINTDFKFDIVAWCFKTKSIKRLLQLHFANHLAFFEDGPIVSIFKLKTILTFNSATCKGLNHYSVTLTII